MCTYKVCISVGPNCGVDCQKCHAPTNDWFKRKKEDSPTSNLPVGTKSLKMKD